MGKVKRQPLVALAVPARLGGFLGDLAALLWSKRLGSGGAALATATATGSYSAGAAAVLAAVGQLSADSLLDHAKGVCGKIFVFMFGHGAIIPRIRGAYQPQEFQTVPLPINCNETLSPPYRLSSGC